MIELRQKTIAKMPDNKFCISVLCKNHLPVKELSCIAAKTLQCS